MAPVIEKKLKKITDLVIKLELR